MLLGVRARTLWMFLLGSRAAVLDAAAGWRVALVAGALLVLSAGLARNYDGEDLRSEPWWLLGPYAASIITSLGLFCIYKLLAAGKGATLPARLYVPFLALYWLTAPLAWLYGVPYEKFLSPVDAVLANAATLAVVALWRVLLMARVAQVLLGCSLRSAVLVDLWFGIAAIWLASLLGPKPVLDVMGGLRLSDVERVRAELVLGTLFWGLLATIVLAVPAILAARRMRLPRLAELASVGPSPRAGVHGTGRAWTAAWLAALAVVAWVPALVVEQPRQRHAWRVHTAIDTGRFDEAATLLADATPERMPAGWHVPIGGAYMDRQERLNGMLGGVERSPPRVPPWVRRQLVDTAGDSLITWGYAPRGQAWAEILDGYRADIAASTPREYREGNARLLRWMAGQADVLTDGERRAVERGLSLFAPEQERDDGR